MGTFTRGITMNDLHEIESRIFNELGILLSIIPDGKPHRFYDPYGKPRNRDGAYRASNLPGTSDFICSIWSYNSGSPLSSAVNKARVFVTGGSTQSSNSLTPAELTAFYKNQELLKQQQSQKKRLEREQFANKARKYIAKCPRLRDKPEV